MNVSSSASVAWPSRCSVMSRPMSTDADRAVPGVEDRRHRQRDRDRHAVLAPDLRLEMPDVLAGGDRVEMSLISGRRWSGKSMIVAPDHFGLHVPEDALRAAVPTRDPVGGIVAEHGVVGCRRTAPRARRAGSTADGPTRRRRGARDRQGSSGYRPRETSSTYLRGSRRASWPERPRMVVTTPTPMGPNRFDDIVATLRAHGERVTGARTAVLRVLLDSDHHEHRTAADIARGGAGRRPRAAPGDGLPDPRPARRAGRRRTRSRRPRRRRLPSDRGTPPAPRV